MNHRALVLADLRGPALDELRRLVTVVYDPGLGQAPPRLYDPERLAGMLAAEQATILITEADHVAGPVLDLPLAVVASTRGDPTNVDVAAATRRRIPVLHTPGRNADAVAEMTVALLFAVRRHLLAADREVRDGTVYPSGEALPQWRHRAWQLAGRTFGIVGLGAVGRAVRWRMAGLGMTVIAHDPAVTEAAHTLPALLAEADVVSMHAPLTDRTRGMIGPAGFAAMRDGAVYLNTARAGLHDTEALLGALRSGKISGAGLDHFEGEWLDPSHPLTGMPNVVLTPHLGGATYDTEVNHTTMIVDDIARLLRGDRPVHCVNPEVLGHSGVKRGA